MVVASDEVVVASVLVASDEVAVVSVLVASDEVVVASVGGAVVSVAVVSAVGPAVSCPSRSKENRYKIYPKAATINAPKTHRVFLEIFPFDIFDLFFIIYTRDLLPFRIFNIIHLEPIITVFIKKS